MYVFIDKNGVLKEIISERPFRSGDSKRNKIYVYFDNEAVVNAGWIKYVKANETLTTETKFYDPAINNLVGKELPQEPKRNLQYFNYNHTYVGGDGLNHIGYKFYEITVPDEVLASATVDSKLCIAVIRFVFADGTELILSQLGAIPFAVEAIAGILPDESINESQYNYLIKLITTVDTGGFELKDLPQNKNYKLRLEIRADGKCHLIAEER